MAKSYTGMGDEEEDPYPPSDDLGQQSNRDMLGGALGAQSGPQWTPPSTYDADSSYAQVNKPAVQPDRAMLPTEGQSSIKPTPDLSGGVHTMSPDGGIDLGGGRTTTNDTSWNGGARGTTTMSPGGLQEPTAGPAPAPLADRIRSRLAAAKSTDDPAYWDRVMAADPNAGGSAWDYWGDRIDRGDGAEGVRNGTVQKYGAGGGSGGAGGGSMGGGSLSMHSNISPENQAWNAQIRQMMMSTLQGLSGPTSEDSPELRPAIGAFNNQSMRDQQSNRDALAERFAASGNGGTDSGAFNSAVQQGMERSAGQRANFTGQAVLQETQQRRQQLTSLLQNALATGQSDLALSIQQELAQLGYNRLGFDIGAKNADLNADALKFAGGR